MVVCSFAKYKIDMFVAKCYLTFMFIYVLHGNYVVSDFVYEDFESTIGIDFNGVASTSSCDEGKRLAYQVNHGSADVNLKTPPSTTEEDTNQAQFQETIMESVNYKISSVTTSTSILGHREKWGRSFYTGCRVRLRLTSSEPSQVGSIWHARPVAVYLGFQTEFTFQIVGRARV